MKVNNTSLKSIPQRTPRTVSSSFYGFMEWIVISFSIGIIVYLAALVYLYKFNADNSIPQHSNIFLQISVILFIALFFWFLGRFLNRYTTACTYISLCALITTCVFIGIVSFSFVSQALILPSSDPRACCILAEQFYNSNFIAVAPTDSYLSLWPFQLSFIFVLEKLMRLFQTTDPIIFQYINCIYLLMIIISGYGIVRSFTRRIEAHLLYLFLISTYIPLILHVYIVYGNLPALAWIICSYCSFLYYNKTTLSWQKGLLAFLFVASTVLAVIYKSNSLIYVIAIVLISFMQQLRKKNISTIVLAIIIFLLSISASSIFQKYYESYANNECGKGVPSIAYVAMALQYNGTEPIPGGWNGFHSDTYMATGYNYEETVRLSKESIVSSLSTFKEDPHFFVHFFHNKVLKQWANQSHGLYWNINSLYDTTRDNNSFWVRHIEHKQYLNLLSPMDLHESIIYTILLLACLLLVFYKKANKEIQTYYLVPFVYFIGGFLFSLIWEAQTIAVIYYPVLLFPIAIGLIFSYIEKRKS